LHTTKLKILLFFSRRASLQNKSSSKAKILPWQNPWALIKKYCEAVNKIGVLML
jgi:hypothetical protein